MKVLIIDDESLARKTLQSFIEEYCTDLQIVGQAANVPEAIKLIAQKKPELLFLDIEMPKISGLELLSFFEQDEVDFQIIFTTAYSQYAVEAFKLSAVDYLLKPINIKQLQSAVKKATINQKVQQQSISALQENLKQQNIQRIVFPTSNGFDFFDVENIKMLKAEGAYTEAHLSNGQKLLVSKSLGEFAKLEKYGPFFKCHRSYMINTNKIKQYYRNDGGYIILKTGEKVPLSKRRRNDFMTILEKMM